MTRTLYIAALSGLTLLGACSNADRIKQAELTNPTGSAFNKSAYTEYLDLAKKEEDQGDRSSARHYITKANVAASGKPVRPDRLSLRDISGSEEAAIKAGHGGLDAALKAGAADRKPAAAAKAQAMLDCWMEQAEEGFQPGDIRACRTGFETAMAELGQKPPMVAEKAPPSGSPFTVNFEFDSVRLTAASRQTMNEVLKKVGIYDPQSVRVVAYTDLVGNRSYNQKLSGRRAAALVKELKAAGVKEVIAEAKGASEPVVNTLEANLSNRRAVIVFQ